MWCVLPEGEVLSASRTSTCHGWVLGWGEVGQVQLPRGRDGQSILQRTLYVHLWGCIRHPWLRSLLEPWCSDSVPPLSFPPLSPIPPFSMASLCSLHSLQGDLKSAVLGISIPTLHRLLTYCPQDEVPAPWRHTWHASWCAVLFISCSDLESHCFHSMPVFLWPSSFYSLFLLPAAILYCLFFTCLTFVPPSGSSLIIIYLSVCQNDPRACWNTLLAPPPEFLIL